MYNVDKYVIMLQAVVQATSVPHHGYDIADGPQCPTWPRCSAEGKPYLSWFIWKYRLQGSKLRGAEGQNAPKLIPNAPRLLNLGAKFCYPIQPDICFEA